MQLTKVKHRIKGKRITKRKKSNLRKTQKGGWRCALPTKLEQQNTYRNPEADIPVNGQNYNRYLEQITNYSECAFNNINNSEAILKAVNFLDNLLNNNLNLTYRKVVDNTNTDYNQKNAIQQRLNANPEVNTINENIKTSKFLDIYATFLLNNYLNLELNDYNTIFLNEDDYNYIIGEDFNIVKNLIISNLIHLNDNVIIKTFLEIIKDTFKEIYLRREFYVSYLIFKTNLITRQVPAGHFTEETTKLIQINLLIIAFIKIFLYYFAFRISIIQIPEIKIIFNLIYKFIYAYLTKKINEFNRNMADNTNIFVSNDVIQRFFIKTTFFGGSVRQLEDFAIFTHLNKTLVGVNCILKQFTENVEKFNILVSEIDDKLSRNIPLRRLADYQFIINDCISKILWSGFSYDLFKEIINLM